MLSFGNYQSWGYFLSAEESVSLWVEYNDCNHIPEISESEDGSIIIKSYFYFYLFDRISFDSDILITWTNPFENK